MIRVLQFAGTINRYDFIDNIIRGADPRRFEFGMCVGGVRAGTANGEDMPQFPRWIVPWSSRRDIPRMAVALARILREWDADILHAHHYDESVIGWLATRLAPRTRLIVGRHYSDAIYRSSAGIKRQILLAGEARVNHAAARILVPSSFIYDILTVRQKINPAKVALVPYGFVPAKYEVVTKGDAERARQELQLGNAIVLGNFARLHEEKGQRFLIQAMVQLRGRIENVRVLILGQGAERAELERQIEDANLRETVQLLGWRSDAMRLMAAVDIVVQPSMQEAFSQAMIEALWLGKPLIMSDVSGAADVIQDGVSGLIVPRGDATALAEAIARLVGDASLRQRLGSAGRAYVQEHLTIDKIIPLYEDVYEQAMGR